VSGQDSTVSSGARSTSEPPPYLLVFAGDTAAIHRLPHEGAILIGRGEGADVALEDPDVSREHAQVVVAGTDVRVADLGSHNGTFVNGERVVSARPLFTGDVVTVGGSSLVFHASPRGSAALATPTALGLGDLRARADAELERSARYGRVFTIVALVGPAIDRARAAHAIAPALRRLDVFAWAGGELAVALLPELDGDDACEAAGRLLDALSPLCPDARAGVASYPLDGGELETLLAGARAAAGSAGPGGVVAASRAFDRLDIGGGDTVLVADPAMTRTYALLRRLAASELPVLVGGETGTGKELAVRALHAWSPRAAGPFVTINCAALPEPLVESELFGHARGAFTGATAAKPGRLEAAAGGTVVLDELGELALATQAKLLRVLETKRAARLGELDERTIDARIVAATNADLAAAVEAGRFRKDLFYRLSAATLWLPPLRDRRREIPLLATAFLADARAGQPPQTIAPEAMQALLAHPWPGNVRELKNLMAYAAATVGDACIEVWHLADRLGRVATRPDPTPVAERTLRPLEEEVRELERARIIEALELAGGNQTRAAALIAMPLRTFQARVKTYGLRNVK
jgi:two-component system, NtrC family, response regulator AtoC